jgi:hypothetical protein
MAVSARFNLGSIVNLDKKSLTFETIFTKTLAPFLDRLGTSERASRPIPTTFQCQPF